MITSCVYVTNYEIIVFSLCVIIIIISCVRESCVLVLNVNIIFLLTCAFQCHLIGRLLLFISISNFSITRLCLFVYKGKDAIKDREERLRLVREKHDEERQRKLEELKQQVISYWQNTILYSMSIIEVI